MQCGLISAGVADPTTHHPERFRVKREPLKRSEVLSPESRVQNLAVTLLYVPCSLDSGTFPKPHSPNLDLPAKIFDLILNGGGAHLHRHHTAYNPHPQPLSRKEAGIATSVKTSSARGIAPTWWIRLHVTRNPSMLHRCVQGAGFRVQGAGGRVQRAGCRVQGSGYHQTRTPAMMMMMSRNTAQRAHPPTSHAAPSASPNTRFFGAGGCRLVGGGGGGTRRRRRRLPALLHAPVQCKYTN